MKNKLHNLPVFTSITITAVSYGEVRFSFESLRGSKGFSEQGLSAYTSEAQFLSIWGATFGETYISDIFVCTQSLMLFFQ